MKSIKVETKVDAPLFPKLMMDTNGIVYLMPNNFTGMMVYLPKECISNIGNIRENLNYDTLLEYGGKIILTNDE